MPQALLAAPRPPALRSHRRCAAPGQDLQRPRADGSERLAQRVRDALGRRETYEALLRYARSLCWDRNLAEDVVQDAMARAIEQAHQYRGSGPVEGWLKAIVRTTFLMAVRGRSEVPTTVDHRLAPSAEEEALARLERSVVTQAVSSCLSDRDQVLVELYYGYGLSQHSIAERLDTTECAIKCQLYRLRRRLARGDAEQGLAEAVRSIAS